MNPIELQQTQANTSVADAADAPVAPADAQYRAKAGAAAEKFEGFFIAHMLRQMRSSTREIAGDDSFFKSSANSDMLDLADNILADKMAGQHAFGIADAILRQLVPAGPQNPGQGKS